MRFSFAVIDITEMIFVITHKSSGAVAIRLHINTKRSSFFAEDYYAIYEQAFSFALSVFCYTSLTLSPFYFYPNGQ